MKQFKLTFILGLAISVLLLGACKKDKDDDPSQLEKSLVISTGARSIAPDQSLSYTATFVDEEGNASSATGVQWTSSDAGVATISATGSLTTAGVGSTTITASVTEDGNTYSASVPLGILSPSVFAVVPSAIIWEATGSMQLEAVFLGINTPTYSYSSSNTAIASVNGSGLVSFHSPGSCEITVTASSHPNNPVFVPVLVVGTPTVSLPVTRIAVTPPSADLFRQESIQLSAQAFNPSGSVSANFTWSSSDPSVASVDANGNVTANAIGSAYIFASAQGISGQSEIFVSPDTIIEVSPLIGSVPAGGSRQYTAKAYNIRTATLLSGITQFDWAIPSYGFPVFDFATVNSAGMVSVNSNAMPGNMTFVTASLPSNSEVVGVGIVMVSLCDCGPGNANVANISISGGALSLNLFSNPMGQITASATNSSGGVVSNPDFRYCSDDLAVAVVDEFTGEVSAAGPGTTVLRVCSGGYAEATTSVTVSF